MGHKRSADVHVSSRGVYPEQVLVGGTVASWVVALAMGDPMNSGSDFRESVRRLFRSDQGHIDVSDRRVPRVPRSSSLPDGLAIGEPAIVESQPNPFPHLSWRRRYARVAAAGDLLVAASLLSLIVFLSSVFWWVGLAHVVVLSSTWVMWLYLVRAYEPGIIGDGAEEYRRVLMAATALTGIVAVAGVLWGWEQARAAVLSLMLTGVLTLLWRRFLRAVLHRRRASGQDQHKTMLVGSASAVQGTAQNLGRDRYHGLQVEAAYVLDGPAGMDIEGIDRVVTRGPIAQAAQDAGVDTVALLPSADLGSDELRDLIWTLRANGMDLLVAPMLLEVSGPRLTVRAAEGLSMFHVSHPELSGARRALKTGFDKFLATFGLLLLSPLLLTVALAIKVTSPGPVFFRQDRVGEGGRTFQMTKFRSMVPDAEALREDLEEQNVHADGRMFKMADDPRVTSVGRWLRRYSVDELPQLFNVLTGDMSLVGPRPPLPREVEHYDRFGQLRFRVRPGLTGLWQVSGRSDVDPEQALDMDVRYVENWSLAQDAVILWKTGRAVLHGDGAY